MDLLTTNWYTRMMPGLARQKPSLAWGLSQHDQFVLFKIVSETGYSQLNGLAAQWQGGSSLLCCPVLFLPHRKDKENQSPASGCRIKPLHHRCSEVRPCTPPPCGAAETRCHGGTHIADSSSSPEIMDVEQ